MKERTTEEVLRDTRELVEQGWRRGADYWAGSYCTRGAIRQASEILRAAAPLNSFEWAAQEAAAQEAAYKAVVKKLPLSWRLFRIGGHQAMIVRWNDYAFRRKQQVLRVLDKAIKAEAKKAAKARKRAEKSEEPCANLPGPSRTITVEPIEEPAFVPEPEPQEAPEQPAEPEKVPA